MTIKIRPACVNDAPALSRLGAITFRETFEVKNTPEDIARYLAEALKIERGPACNPLPAHYRMPYYA